MVEVESVLLDLEPDHRLPVHVQVNVEERLVAEPVLVVEVVAEEAVLVKADQRPRM